MDAAESLALRLPGLSGYDVCWRPRQDGMADTLMAEVTGLGREEDRNDSREAGCEAHLVKPVKFPELLGILEGQV